MSLNLLRDKLFKNEKFREEYYKKDLSFEISQMLVEARVLKGMTQRDLAEKVGTQQPSIARIENGSLPSLTFLERIAQALGTYLIPPAFGFMENRYPNTEVYSSIRGVIYKFQSNFVSDVGSGYLMSNAVPGTSTVNSNSTSSI